MTNQIIDEEIAISAPVSMVWDALTNPDITEIYWGGTRIESDWKAGSKIFYRRDGEIVDEHELREILPLRFLEHTFKPVFSEFQGEPPSLVSFLLREEGGITHLTILHRNFPPESKVYDACSGGWPAILRSLKAVLESDGEQTT